MKMRSEGVLLLLALASVSRADPVQTLTEQQLDLSGRWFVHALSSDTCVVSVLMPFFQFMSLAMDLSFRETPDKYRVTPSFKMLGICQNKTDSIKINTQPLQKADGDVTSWNVLPQSFCSDCMVVVLDKEVKTLGLFSRRQALTVAELRSFQIQASGLNFTSPFLLDGDYDFTNCRHKFTVDEDDPELIKLQEKFSTLMNSIENCAQG